MALSSMVGGRGGTGPRTAHQPWPTDQKRVQKGLACAIKKARGILRREKESSSEADKREKSTLIKPGILK